MSIVRIAMVAACPFPSPQGSQVFVAQMCERLAARGHDLHLLTYGQGHEVTGRGYLHHRIRRLPRDDASRSGPTLTKPALDLMLARELIEMLGQQSFDVIHCHNYEAAVVGLVARMRRSVPVVYHSHNLMGDELATYFVRRGPKLVAGALGRLLDARIPRAADQVIALCSFTADVMLSRGVRAERISVIPPAVEDEGPAAPAEDARRRLGLPLDEPLVGYCGNLDAYQGLGTLLEAFTEASDQQRLLLVATHAADGRFSRALSDRGLQERVRVVEADGWACARSVMEACDVLVLPRRHGSGWPIKLLNYMSMGRPIVAAGCGAKILQDAITALLVPDDDPRALSAAIDRALGDKVLRRRLGVAARRLFLREFTWDAVLPALENVYHCLGRAGALPTSRVRYNVGG